jgi:hypothetical protein
MAATVHQRENEDERALTLELRQIAASAGNVFDQAILKSIIVDGPAEYAQDRLRAQVTPDMPFSKVQSVFHQLGKSLRRTLERSHSVGGSKKKEEHACVRTGRTSAFAVEDDGDDSSISGQLKPKSGVDSMEAALLAEGTRYPYGYNWIWSTPSHSPDGSVFSVPKRGWEIPSASVASASIGGSRIPRGITRQNLCFMCYKPGHVISDCPQLPGEVREQAAHNRALYYKDPPNPQVDFDGTLTPELRTMPIARKSYRAAVVTSARPRSL